MTVQSSIVFPEGTAVAIVQSVEKMPSVTHGMLSGMSQNGSNMAPEMATAWLQRLWNGSNMAPPIPSWPKHGPQANSLLSTDGLNVCVWSPLGALVGYIDMLKGLPVRKRLQACRVCEVDVRAYVCVCALNEPLALLLARAANSCITFHAIFITN